VSVATVERLFDYGDVYHTRWRHAGRLSVGVSRYDHRTLAGGEWWLPSG
jgi:hypothetical protein